MAAFCLLVLAAIGVRRQWFPHPTAERVVSAVELAVLVVLGVIGLAALVIRRWDRQPQEPADPSGERAGFVMQTFQEVLRQLKEKEAELEHLRARAVARAEAVESYHENILRGIASGVVTCDPAGRITTFNAAAERILGHAAASVVGRPGQEVFGAENPIAIMLQQSLDTRAAISRQEWQFQRGHERVWVGLSSALLRDRADQLIGAAVVFTDLTEIKRLEERIESERRMAVMGEMSAAIAHEFRNSMGTIQGWAKLLGNQVGEDQRVRPMVEAITSELVVMERLIEDLLAFGRRLEPQLQPVAFKALVDESLAVPQTRRDVRLNVRWDEGVPETVVWDPTLMRQVLKNLVQNAVEAMPDGGAIDVAVSSARDREDSVDLVISDTGTGIPPEHVDRIFEPFFTLKARGHGLGLALVRKIVTAHGGQIAVLRTGATGTAFRVTVPVRINRHSNAATRLAHAA